MKKKIFGMVLILGFALIGFNNGHQVSVHTVADNVVDDEYSFGTMFTVPVKSITHNGETKEASFIVLLPDGASVLDQTFALNQYGQYTIVYSADFAGETISERISFYVPYDTYNNDDGCRVSYGNFKYDSSIYGLHVSLNNGSKFNYAPIIDLNKIDPNNPFVKVFSEVEEQGVFEASEFVITLTDAYDVNNTLKVRVKKSPYANNENWFTYVEAKGGSQPYGAIYYTSDGAGGVNTKYYIASQFGTSVRFSFNSVVQYGSTAQKPITAKDGYLGFAYDPFTKELFSVNDDKIIHTGNAGKSRQLIADFDDPKMYKDKWGGFTTGEVTLSFEVTGFIGTGAANFFFSEIAGHDLSSPTFRDEIGPTFTFDANYQEDEYPYAVVGTPYKLFGTSGHDSQSSVREKEVKVYTDYGAPTQKVVPIAKNSFIPTEAKKHTLVYRFIDVFGNETIKTITINCLLHHLKMFINIATPSAATTYCGQPYRISDYTVVGESGNVTLTAKAIKMNSGKVYDIVDGYFTPTQAGKYNITYSVRDYLGEVAINGYTLNVEEYQGVLFVAPPQLPKYFINAFEYELRPFYGVSYQNGQAKSHLAQLQIIDDAGERLISDNVYKPQVNASTDIVLTYSVGSDSVSFTVPCIRAFTGPANSFDKKAYFAGGADLITESSTNNVSLQFNSNSARAEFINPVLADGFNFTFYIDKSYTDFTTIKITLTDSENAAELIVVKYINTPSGVVCVVNDGDAYPTDYNFYAGENTLFDLQYSNSGRQIIDGIENRIFVKETANGKVFNGFSSGKIYVAMQLEGVNSPGKICVKKINRCPMNNKTTNPLNPEFAFNDNFESSGLINCLFETPLMISSSVLNPIVRLTMTVKNPDRQVVTATDGTVLENVSVERKYLVNGDEYGTYSISFLAVDSLGVEETYNCGFTIIDRTKPLIEEVTNLPSTAKVGDTIQITLPKVTDNYSEVNLSAYYLTPNGDLILLKNEALSFVVTMKGKYVVRFYAVDKYGNSQTCDYPIMVE
ncbi:MAG: hypothetical protein ACOX3K_00795 [Bacilli bacterium]|jgi:hypothetical protein